MRPLSLSLSLSYLSSLSYEINFTFRAHPIRFSNADLLVFTYIENAHMLEIFFTVPAQY